MSKTPLAALFLTILACTLMSQSSPQVAPQAPKPASASSVQPTTGQLVTVVGQNYCLGCALKKQQGAAAQCSIYGHRHAIKVESAVGEDGKPLEALRGTTLHYLDNDKSSPLIKGEDFHGKRIEVKGKLYGPEGTIEVIEFKSL